MEPQILGVVVMFIATLLLAVPLGRYIAKVYAGQHTWTDGIFNPIEKLFFRISRIDPTREMNWKQHLTVLLTINLIWVHRQPALVQQAKHGPEEPDKIDCQQHGQVLLPVHFQYDT